MNETADEAAKAKAEFANEEFDRFLNLMDLEHKFEDLEDDEDKENGRALRRTLVRAILEGTLTIDDQGEATYRPKKGNTAPIHFPEPEGAVLQAIDRKKSGHKVAQTYAMLAAWTEENAARFSKMKRRDLTVCTSMVNLFFG